MKEAAFGKNIPTKNFSQENHEKTERKVVIERIPPKQETRGTMAFEEYRIMNEGSVIGELMLVVSTPKGREHTAYLNTIKLYENEDSAKNFKGKGYGTATYMKIIENVKERGIKFLSSGSQLSKDAYLLWEKLVAAGLAKKIREGTFDESSPEAGYTDAEYEAI